LEAGLLAWYGLVRGQLHFRSGLSRRQVLSFALVLYSLAVAGILLAIDLMVSRQFRRGRQSRVTAV
jgi:hypothetical protein